MADINGTRTSHSLGLLDPTVSQLRRHQLDTINKLHSLGAQLDIDVPQIVVIGSQSAGKSSLIESISGITLPRSSGTCTRCPTECFLIRSHQPWECLVSLRFFTDESGHQLPAVRNVSFGPPIQDPPDVEERVRRAQRAALNPGVDCQQFLDNAPGSSPVTNALDFTTNCVSLEIRGSDLIDLSFCDLPGLIASVSETGHDGDVEKVTELVSSYISKPSCIVLLTVACESDFENQGAHRLAKIHDPEGTRTIGVLTKPDRIPFGEEARWIKLIKNDGTLGRARLDNGWYCVKQPSSTELSEADLTFQEARRRGEAFFDNTPWSALEPEHRNKLGTRALTQKLNEYLMALISKRFPELLKEIQKALQRTKDELQKHPAPTFKDPIMEVMHLIGDFSDDMFRHAQGISYGIPGPSTVRVKGFNQFEHIRRAHEDFRQKMRSTAPHFQPFDRPVPPDTPAVVNSLDMVYDSPRPAVTEDLPSTPLFEEKVSLPYSSNPIYLDDVVERVQDATTRELPGYYPFQVLQDLISCSTGQWEEPAHSLVDSVYWIVLDHHSKLIELYFGKYTSGGLQQAVSRIMQEFSQKSHDRAIERVKWLLELEAHAFTLNQHYLDDYRNKFLEHFKTQRQNHFRRHFHPATEPWSPNQYALEIMATVRAYFQVAYKRVVDTLPLAIDRELVRLKRRDVQEAISLGLGITGSEAQQCCEKFLAEPPEVVVRRGELRSRLDRLTKAQSELKNI